MKRKNLFIIYLILTMLVFAAAMAGAFPQQELHRDGSVPEAEERQKAPESPDREENAPQAEAQEESEAPDEVQEQEGEEEIKSFSYSISPPEISLDPIHTFTSTEAQVYTALFEGLVSYNPFTLEPLPGIAARWEISRDRKTYTFHIRDNAVYSNGDPILAEHVRETWFTLIDPEQKAEYASSIDMIKNVREYRTGRLENREDVGISVEGERILKVELEHPAAHFLKVLCHHSFAPLHPTMLEEIPSEEPGKLVSNGPFYISGKEENALVLKKNQLYWDKSNVALDELRIVYNDDPEETALLFNKNKLHWIDGSVNVDSLDNQTAVVVNPLFSTSYFFFSAQKPAFADPGVRRALAMLFPWSQIRSQEYMYLPAETLVPTFSGYPKVDGIAAQDVEGALELLEEIGVSAGEGLPKIQIALPQGEEALRIGTLMKEAIEEHLSTDAEISQYPFHEYYDVLKEQPFTIGMLTWIGDYADPLTFLQMWTSDSSLNLADYRDDTYDGLIQDSMAQEGETRYETLAEAESQLLQGAIVLPIKNSPAFNIIDMQSIDGWFPNPLDIHPFKYLGFSQPTLPDGVVMLEGRSRY